MPWFRSTHIRNVIISPNFAKRKRGEPCLQAFYGEKYFLGEKGELGAAPSGFHRALGRSQLWSSHTPRRHYPGFRHACQSWSGAVSTLRDDVGRAARAYSPGLCNDEVWRTAALGDVFSSGVLCLPAWWSSLRNRFFFPSSHTLLPSFSLFLLIPFSISFLSAFMLSGPRGRAEVEGAKGPRNLGSLPPSGARPLWPSLVTAEFGNTATQIVVVLCAVGSMSGQPQTCRSVNFHPDSHSFTIYRRLPSGNQAWKWCPVNALLSEKIDVAKKRSKYNCSKELKQDEFWVLLPTVYDGFLVRLNSCSNFWSELDVLE